MALARSRLKCLSMVVFSLVFCCFVYYQVSINVEGAYNYKNMDRSCKTAEKEMNTMVLLIRSTHSVLEKLRIPHFLVYGSIWGAIRFKNPLPWDYDFDFGVIRPDIDKLSTVDIEKAFAEENIYFYYRPYAGVYRVERDGAGGDLIIFEDWNRNGVMQRIGLESYLLFLHYRKYHQFPARLVTGKLPSVEFAGVNISVPKGENEILKFLYPTNWWKEVRPAGCK